MRKWDGVLSKDPEIIINSIQNARTKEEFDSIIFKDYVGFEAYFSEEQKERLAQILAHKLTTNAPNGMDGLIRRIDEYDYSNILIRAIEINPYVMDYVSKVFGGHGVKLNKKIKELPEGKYVPSYYTPTDFFNMRPDLFMMYYRRHFEEASNPSRFSGNFLEIPDSEDFLREIYEVALENGYSLTQDSPEYLRKNPYLYFDAVTRGNIVRDSYFERRLPKESSRILRELFIRSETDTRTEELLDNLMAKKFYIGQGAHYISSLNLDSWEQKIIKSPKFIIRSLRENIYSALQYRDGGVNGSLDELSLEDFKAIADVYKEIDKTNIPTQLLLAIEESPLFAENPYILLEKYRNNQNVPKHSENVPFSDEMQREIADIFFRRKGRPLQNNDLNIEKSNPYIIRYSIERDPTTIDVAEIPKNNSEIEKIVLESLKDGRYHINDNTPEVLIKAEIIRDYLANEGDLSNIKTLGRITRHLFTNEQEETIIRRALEEAENGNLSNLSVIRFERVLSIDETTRIINIVLNKTQDGSELGVPVYEDLPLDVVKRACFSNPNNIKYLNGKKLQHDEEFIKYMADSIRTGRFIIDDNIPEFFNNVPELLEELFRNTSNLLVVSPYFLNSFIINELGIDEKFIQALDEGTLELPEIINYENISSIFNNPEDKKIDKFCRYVLEKRPEELQNLYLNLKSDVSDEYRLELVGKMLEAIRNGQIQIDDDFPFEKLGDDDLTAEVIRRNPRLIPKANLYYRNLNFSPQGKTAKLLKEMYGEDWFDLVFGDRADTEFTQTNHLFWRTLIDRRVSFHPEEIVNINPAVVFRPRRLS